MNFDYLLTPAPAAYILIFAGAVIIIGGFFATASQRIGSQLTGFVRRVTFLAGGLVVAFGLFMLFAAPERFRQAQTMQIDAAIYGRGQSIPPTVPPFPLATIDCTPYARATCDTHSTCSLLFSNKLCGSDPDAGTLKVVEVIYRCGTEPATRAFFVEGRTGTLTCR